MKKFILRALRIIFFVCYSFLEKLRIPKIAFEILTFKIQRLNDQKFLFFFFKSIGACDATNPCSGHGSCEANGKCNCNKNWYGEKCGGKLVITQSTHTTLSLK